MKKEIKGMRYTTCCSQIFAPDGAGFDRPRYQVHYTPTYSSWLNQVERWFALITQRAIRRSSFPSVKELVEKIDTLVEHYYRSH